MRSLYIFSIKLTTHTFLCIMTIVQSRLFSIFFTVTKATFLYRHSSLAILKNIIIALMIHLLIGFSLACIANDYFVLETTHPTLPLVVSSIIAQLSSIIPISPGGLGVGETAFANSLFYLNHQIALPYATVYFTYRIYNIIFALPAMILLLFNHSLITAPQLQN